MPRTGGIQPTKETPCRDCGSPVTVSTQATGPARCFECGVAAHVDAVRQMHEKKGPVYEKWLASNGSSGAMRGNQNARKG